MEKYHQVLGETCWVVFSDDWGRHPSSSQHLIKCLLPHTKVIWVNTIGLRTPQITVYDLKRALEILKRWVFPQKKNLDSQTLLTSPHLQVISPFMFPFYGSRIFKKINDHFLLRAILKATHSVRSTKKLIHLTTIPITAKIASSPIWDKRVYYCVDDFAHWPGIDGSIMRKLETQLLKVCDITLVVSEALYQARKPLCSKIHLLTHGVEVSHFSQVDPHLPSPDIFKHLSKPILGFFGLIDARLDQEIVLELAHSFPQATLLLLGPIDIEIGALKQFQNIVLPGAIPYPLLPQYASQFDVCILPYKINENTHNINPLKLKEYLATLKPVVSTPLKEAQKLAPYLTLADKSEFVKSVQTALEKKDSTTFSPDQLSLEDFLRGETWQAKAHTFLEAIFEAP